MSTVVNDSGERIVKTVCSTCYCGCGVLAHVKDERITGVSAHVTDRKVTKIEGDPDHPMNSGELCLKGLSGIELLYHPERLNYPLKRAGKRGEGKWQRISWDEALDTIADKLKEIKEQHGAEAISLALGAALYSNSGMLGNFAYWLGTPNILCSGYICFLPAALAARATIGYQVPIHCSEVVGDEILYSNCILLWAANPKNTFPYPLGEGIFQAKEKGAKLIVVDPRPTDYAKIADLWLQIRPATDDALALGMINVVINEGLYDETFVADWTYGYDELKKHVQKYPPDEVSKITWIPEKDIVAAARMFAKTRPSCVCQRVPLDQNLNAVQTSRAIFILNAICGNIDIKGGNLLPQKGTVTTEAELFAKPDQLPSEIFERRIGSKEIPLLSGLSSMGGMVHPTLWTNAVLTGKPYPIKALINSAHNQILAEQDSKIFEKALRKLDFFVTMDLFMTPTGELSDIILPAASWLERDGFRGHSAYPYVIPIQHKALEPLYERWDDNQFFIELAKKLSLDMPWQSVEEFNDFRVQGRGITFKALDGINFIRMPKEYERYKKGQFEFNTPSKKVELYSTFLEKFGYDPLPNYVAPPGTTPKFPLIFMGGKKKLEYIHTTGRQIKMLREKAPEPTLEMNPKTADERGIAEGDWVFVETIYFGDRERIKFRAKLVEGFPKRLVAADHGWWFPELKDPKHGCFESNPNVVTPGDLYDPIYGSTNLKSIPCRIYKA
jgi:anaerobic selenocysteine-containing dehydrogenase